MTDSTTTPALDLEAIEARLKAIEPYGFPDQWRAELFEENEPQAPNGWIVFGQDDSVEAAICTVFGGNQDPETISKFIAGARQDIPAMVAEIRSLREANNRMSDGLRRWCEAFQALTPEVAKLKAAPLAWTAAKPTEDGWYCWRSPGANPWAMAEVRMFTGAPCWHSAERAAWVAVWPGMEWAGPIPTPGEDKREGQP